MTGTPRKPVPADVAANVLIKSRRRCCLCFYWELDDSQKDGQLAHIDRDSSNSAEENLVYLCFRHHNKYDAKGRIGKNLTAKELRYTRDQLYAAMAALPTPHVSVTIEINREFDAYSQEDQAHLLETVKHALNRQSDLHILTKRRGSVRLSLKLSAPEALRLIEAVQDGALSEAGVSDAGIDEVIEPSRAEPPEVDKGSTEISDSEQAHDEEEAERRKREVGMAPYGTDEYWRNAKYILSAYKRPNAETLRKLEELRRRGYLP